MISFYPQLTIFEFYAVNNESGYFTVKGMKPTSLLLSFPFALESFRLSNGIIPIGLRLNAITQTLLTVIPISSTC